MKYFDQFLKTLELGSPESAGSTGAAFIFETRDNPSIEEVRQRIRVVCNSAEAHVERVFDTDDPALSRFFLVRFSGGVLTDDSSSLFDLCYDLQDAFDLVSADVCPNKKPAHVGEGYGDLPESGSSPPVDCSKENLTDDTEWFLKNINVEKAWELCHGRGKGILVGQPDTGVSDHHTLFWGAVDERNNCNLLEPGKPPVDPLPRHGNPGHGTSVASNISSRGKVEPGRKSFRGIAPEAAVLPIRCTESVVVWGGDNGVAVKRLARSIEIATNAGCQIISMSLGVISFRLYVIEKALRYAAEKGVIIVAAAGNSAHGTGGPAVYPAISYYSSCVAGSNVHYKGYRDSLGGPLVTISAPAECVWSAWRLPNDHIDDPQNYIWRVGRGSGTSYATAIVAGLAALWVSYHGHENLRRRFPGAQLTRAFQSILRATANIPARWSSWYYGAGIADAEKLLRKSLESAAMDTEIADSPEDLTRRRIRELLAVNGKKSVDMLQFDDAFMERYGRELEMHLSLAEFASSNKDKPIHHYDWPPLSFALQTALTRIGADSVIEIFAVTKARDAVK